MAKILEKKSIKNGKEYTQYQVTVSPTLMKALGWNAGDDLEIKSDPQNIYAVMQKISGGKK